MSSHENLASFDTIVDPEAAKVKNEMLWRVFKPVCLAFTLIQLRTNANGQLLDSLCK